MMVLVEEGKIGTIITKDMSRIGRNYLEVGMYTEITFPQNNVRFIAVNSGVDSANQQDNEFVPFVNIINEYYVRDGSKKVRTSLRLKGESGEHLTTIPPYGYVKDPDNSHVGIVGGKDANGELLIIHCASGYNNVVITGKEGFTSISRPRYYAE